MELPARLYQCPHCEGIEVYGNNHPEPMPREGNERTYDALVDRYGVGITSKLCSPCLGLRG